MRSKGVTRIQKTIKRFLYNSAIKNRILKEVGKNSFEIIDPKRVWFISDMHFNHYNIIKWCRYPFFRNVKQMNNRMVSNWNYHVGYFDKMFCLGDFGDFRYKKRLKGNITIAKGNHDKKQWNQQYILKYRNMKFLLLHDPDDPMNPTRWFDGDWIIHGHTHINSPFIDIRKKRVNVSCEVINFTPLSMEDLYTILQESKNYEDNRKFL
jgi:calcineurin-like phosphoesterase family protein